MSSGLLRFLPGYRPLRKNVRIHHEIERWSWRTPEAPALVTESRLLTYRELDERANRLARRLQAQGVGPGAVVATCFDRCIEMVVASLAVLKTGAAYLPVSADFPPDRIRFMLEDSGARLGLTLGAFRGALPGDFPVLALDEEGAAPAGGGGTRVDVGSGETPAAIIYTSGSTGRPKGAIIPHRGIVRLAHNQTYVRFGPGRRFLSLASPSFDAMFFETWAPLMTGGAVVLFEGQWPELPRMETLIRAFDVRALFITTSLFNQIVDLRPSVLATVAEVLVGGEALSVAHVQRAAVLLPRTVISNIYGPTECTTFACAGVIGPQFTWGCASVPIGRPIRHTECHIVDERLQPVADGVAGELLLGGEGLALGYLNRPELTAEKFIPHPWRREPGAKLYRTGDRFRRLPNGALEFVGRMDDQVKVNGFRIELGEIESVAQGAAGVALAVAAYTGQPGDRKQLVLFVTARPGVVVDPAAVRAEFERRLPGNVTPGHIVVVAGIPLTANGKADRAALLRDWEQDAAATGALPEGRGLEGRLVRAWRRLLRRTDVGKEADFFASGGDSLLAMELALELQNELGRPVPVGVVFRHPTPVELAKFLADGGEAFGMLGEGPGAPLFYVPEIHGVGRLPAPLVQRLAGRRRYFDSLQYPGAGGGTPCERVEDIAAALVQQVAAVHPEGPLCLYGFSFGGMVAYEMARQLAAQGRPVAMVLLGDIAPAPALVPLSKLEQVGVRLRDVGKPTWRAAPRKLFNLVRFSRDLVRGRVRQEAYPRVCRTDVARASHRAYETYVPGPYAGPIGLVICEQPVPSLFKHNPPREDLGWRRYVTGPLHIRRIPGDHGQMYEDNAAVALVDLLDEGRA